MSKESCSLLCISFFFAVRIDMLVPWVWWAPFGVLIDQAPLTQTEWISDHRNLGGWTFGSLFMLWSGRKYSVIDSINELITCSSHLLVLNWPQLWLKSVENPIKNPILNQICWSSSFGLLTDLKNRAALDVTTSNHRPALPFLGQQWECASLVIFLVKLFLRPTGSFSDSNREKCKKIHQIFWVWHFFRFSFWFGSKFSSDIHSIWFPDFFSVFNSNWSCFLSLGSTWIIFGLDRPLNRLEIR